MIVGEAPGEQEEMIGLPFVGPTGQFLTELLRGAEIAPRECYFTNVLFTRPPNNQMEHFCVQKAALPKGYDLPPLGSGAYLHPDLLPELDRLFKEIENVNPNLILALGATAAWALTRSAKISAVRGTIAAIEVGNRTYKVLPSYHPAFIFKDWSKRVILMADLLKARKEMQFPEIVKPRRELIIDPSFRDIEIILPSLLEKEMIACDTETSHGQITMIGFAWEIDSGIVIPFWGGERGSYWDIDTEIAIWKMIKDLLGAHPNVTFQNGLYDLQYLWRMGIPVPGFQNDTMLLHHALYPELPKGLGFLGSVYTSESAWKNMRRRGSHTNKRDE